jgi:proteic killer suppression protein
MEVEFDHPDLERLEVDPAFDAGFAREVVRGFRRVMRVIRAALDERDLYRLKGLRFKKLKGKRQHQHSLRINGQWRLIVELHSEESGKRVGVVEIVDYH